MTKIKIILSVFLALLMLIGVYGHLANPEFYHAFVPEFIPENIANLLAAMVEGVIGIALIIPKYRKWGALGFFLLMIIFLPIHAWDLVREQPAIGSFKAAVIRFVVQLLLIFAGWWLYSAHGERRVQD